MSVIPAERLRPIIERYVAENEGALYEKTHGSLPRRIYRALHEVEELSMDTADRLLVDMGASHEWHGELADLYETTGTSRKPTGVESRLTGAQIRAAWTLYQHGLSISDIAAQSWERIGYKSKRGCEDMLRKMFKRHGYKTRSRGEARRLNWAITGCASCGAPKDERTEGCDVCTSRHLQRKMRGGGGYIDLEKACVGCGCDPDERTFACNACISRHSSRRMAGNIPYAPGPRHLRSALASRSGLGGLSTGRAISSSPRGGTSEGTTSTTSTEGKVAA